MNRYIIEFVLQKQCLYLLLIWLWCGEFIHVGSLLERFRVTLCIFSNFILTNVISTEVIVVMHVAMRDIKLTNVKRQFIVLLSQSVCLKWRGLISVRLKWDSLIMPRNTPRTDVMEINFLRLTLALLFNQ